MTTREREHIPSPATLPEPSFVQDEPGPVQVRMVPVQEKIEVPCAHTPEEINDLAGRMPVRTELTVLSADDPKTAPLGWMMYELDGTEVYRDAEQTQTITRREDLKPGDVIYAQTLFNLCKAVVDMDEDGSLFAIAGSTLIYLDFREDPKEDPRAPCWVSPGAANMRAVQRLMETSK
jgi:hypothetical protein